MRICARGVGLAALLTAFLVSPAAVVAQSLTDALIQSYHNSELLKANRALLRSTDEGVVSAWAALKPNLVASSSNSATNSLSGGGTSFTSSLSLTSQLVLWNGGTSRTNVEIANLNVKIGRQVLKNLEQAVLLNAATAFMNMRRDAQFLQLAENNMQVIEQQVAAAKDRFEVGDVTRTTVSQAEARLAEALSSVAYRQGNLEIARQVYFSATGNYPGILKSPPPTPSIPSTLAKAKDIARRTNPSVVQAQLNAKLAELSVALKKAARLPKFTGTGTLTSSSSTGETATVTLGGSMTLYGGGALSAAERSASALKEQADFNVHQAGLETTQSVVQAWSQLKIARAMITARQKQIRSARVALRGVVEEANLGARTTLDVLDAEQELVSAQSNLVVAKRDEYVAVYSLLSSMGLLTVEHLRLGIRTYDVEANLKKITGKKPTSSRGTLLDKLMKRSGKKN